MAKILTRHEFVSRANKQHNNKYEYLNLDVYKNLKSVLHIKCKNCSKVFKIVASRHLSRNCGCPKCKSEKYKQQFIKPLEQLKTELMSVHGDKYTYLNLNKNKNIKDRLIILCRKCKQRFKQTVRNHLHNETGCPYCVGYKRSRVEDNWLDFLKLPNDEHHRQFQIPQTKYVVDGYNSLTNTIYEFLGDYWHGNPNRYNQTELNKTTHKTFGELYSSTFVRFKHLESLGYVVVYIWENDWRKIYKQLKKSKPK